MCSSDLAEEPDPAWFGLGVNLPGPLWAEAPSDWPGRVTSRPENALGSVWLAPPLRMKELMPMMRQAKELGSSASCTTRGSSASASSAAMSLAYMPRV